MDPSLPPPHQFIIITAFENPILNVVNTTTFCDITCQHRRHQRRNLNSFSVFPAWLYDRWVERASAFLRKQSRHECRMLEGLVSGKRNGGIFCFMHRCLEFGIGLGLKLLWIEFREIDLSRFPIGLTRKDDILFFLIISCLGSSEFILQRGDPHQGHRAHRRSVTLSEFRISKGTFLVRARKQRLCFFLQDFHLSQCGCIYLQIGPNPLKLRNNSPFQSPSSCPYHPSLLQAYFTQRSYFGGPGALAIHQIQHTQ